MTILKYCNDSNKIDIGMRKIKSTLFDNFKITQWRRIIINRLCEETIVVPKERSRLTDICLLLLVGLKICWLYFHIPHQKVGVLGMSLNCIWCWALSSGHLGSVEYPFITINPNSTLTWNGNTFLGPIYESGGVPVV